MADDIQKKISIEEGSEALQGDIAKILQGVKLSETPAERMSREINTSDGDIEKVVEDVGLLKTSGVKTSAVPPIVSGDISKVIEDVKLVNAQNAAAQEKVSSAPQDFSKILEEVKLPEARDVRMSGDIPVAQVMPKEPPISVALAGTKEAQAAREKIDSNMTGSKSPEVKKAVEKGAVVPLRTLKDDMSSIVENSKISLIRAASLEEEKKSKATKITSMVEEKRARQRSRHILAMVFAIFMLFGIGAAALFGVYTITSLQRGTQSQNPASSILFAEHSLSLVIDGQSSDQIKQILGQARVSSTGAIGSIARIVPVISSVDANGVATQRQATLKEFLTALGAHAPDDLLRALSDSFFFGIHTVNKNAPVFVIPVVSYSRAFAGMLAWEPSMNADLVPIFTVVPALTRDENDLPVLRKFQDSVMNNYDVRELKDDAGEIVLYYSFPTTQVLVIAESPYSFVEILSRLQASRQL
ncbi:hypothetical protein HZC00_04880 [Candidatus Kaiserbacteria bacterium]|nr:hypothetical protein [Candidatus Kaiserbacteria bacterium]